MTAWYGLGLFNKFRFLVPELKMNYTYCSTHQINPMRLHWRMWFVHFYVCIYLFYNFFPIFLIVFFFFLIIMNVIKSIKSNKLILEFLELYEQNLIFRILNIYNTKIGILYMIRVIIFWKNLAQNLQLVN